MIEAFRRSGKVARLVLVAITVPSLIFMLMIAADLSRAPIILLVWFLAGIEYAWRFRPKAAKLLLCLAAVVNFLTPAYQVVANFTIRIEPLWTEVQNLRHPAPGFNAQILTHRATGDLFGKSDWAGALELLNVAVTDDPGFLDAQIGRAFALEQLDRPLDALNQCETMLNSHPESRNAWISDRPSLFSAQALPASSDLLDPGLALLPADNPTRDSVWRSLQNLPADADGRTTTIAPKK